MAELTERDEAILAFEKTWWKHRGAKEQAIKDLFDLSATAYYQRLGDLINRPEALVAQPQLVNRLRRERDRARGARSARHLAER